MPSTTLYSIILIIYNYIIWQVIVYKSILSTIFITRILGAPSLVFHNFIVYTCRYSIDFWCHSSYTEDVLCLKNCRHCEKQSLVVRKPSFTTSTANIILSFSNKSTTEISFEISVFSFEKYFQSRAGFLVSLTSLRFQERELNRTILFLLKTDWELMS